MVWQHPEADPKRDDRFFASSAGAGFVVFVVASLLFQTEKIELHPRVILAHKSGAIHVQSGP